jgi:hypothetical protein
METWRKMFAIPALGVPGVLKVCNILVNSPAPDDDRTTAGAAGAGGAAAGADGAASADGCSRDASRSSSEALAAASFTLPKAEVMLSGWADSDDLSPGTPGAPKGVLDSLIKPWTPEIRLSVW